MIHPATERIAMKFEEFELKYTVEEVGPLSFVSAAFSGKHCNVRMRMISTDEANDVKVLTEDLARFPEDKLMQGYELINALNCRFRYAKFEIDSDGDVTAQYDIPQRTSTEDLGDVALEIAMRLSQIVDESYPEIMKAIWA